MLTSGLLSGLQEVLASWIANDVSKHGHYFSARVPKMTLYGMFISAPLGHLLVGILQKVFAGRTSLKAKILQILASNLIVRFCQTCTQRGKSNRIHIAGLPHSKRSLPHVDGYHRWGAHLPSGPRNR
jgi:hypothetical protein